MATLKAHGEIGQIQYLTYRIACCADGKILKNSGDGWKLYRKIINPAVTPEENYQKKLAKFEDYENNRPRYVEFRDAFHGAVPFGDRWRVMAALELLSDDPDGLWSTVNELHDEYPFEEIEALCQAYNLMMNERAEHKQDAVVA